MCTFIICSVFFFFLTQITPNTNKRKRKTKKCKYKSIPFWFAKHIMPSQIVGWLVGVRDVKILELNIKSRINKKSHIRETKHLLTMRIVAPIPQ